MKPSHRSISFRSLLALITTLLLVSTMGVRAAPPPVMVTSFGPGSGGAILVERTEGEFGGDPDGWRMNLDVWLQNNGDGDLMLTEVVIAYDGGSDPADLVIDTATFLANSGRGVLLEDTDNSFAANELPAFVARVAFLPEQRVSSFPVPDQVTVSFFFDGFTDPIVFTRPLVEYASPYSQGSYAFPGAAKDLPADYYWYLGTGHTYRSHHRLATSQRFAEDWGIARWDGAAWTGLHPAGVASNNSDYIIWDIPIYAIADGQVVRCANGYQDNPSPPDKLPGVTSDPATIPGGGNHLWIRHASGERVLYAHFQDGTLSGDLCPVDPDAGEHDVTDGAVVSAGQFLGRAGNSGNSTAPHLHIHSQTSSGSGLPLYYHNARSFEEDHFDPNNDPAPPWNSVDGGAVSSHDSQPSYGVFVEPRKRANVSIVKSSLPAPAVAGTSITTTLDVTNHGPDDASGVSAIDVLPPGFVHDSNTLGCAEAPAGTLTCAIGALMELGQNGEEDETSFEITSDIPADLVFNNGAPVTTDNIAVVFNTEVDDSGADSLFTEEITVIAVADLSVVSFEIVSAPPDVLIGEDANVVVEAVVTSDGPSSPMHATLSLTGSAGGVQATPMNAEISVPELAHGEQRAIQATFTLACSEPGQQMAHLGGEIAPASIDDLDPDSSHNAGMTSITVDCVVPVAINIKPHSFPNSVHPDKANIPIAVLTTDVGEYGLPLAFDATTIQALSVRFGDEDLVWTQTGGAAERHDRGHIEDSYELDESTRDGDLDMVLHFKAAESGLTTLSSTACARGLFTSGADSFSFFGCDSVRTVPGAP